MALGSTMLQLVVDQQLATEVSSVGQIVAEVFEILSLGTVTVREIALEKMGGVAGANSAIPIDFSNTGFATLRLLFPGSKDRGFLSLPVACRLTPGSGRYPRDTRGERCRAHLGRDQPPGRPAPRRARLSR